MARINNPDLIREVIGGAKINISVDDVPSELGKTVVPVMETNPKLLRVCDIVKIGTCENATSTAIYTTPTNKDFYLSSLCGSWNKDIVNDGTFAAVSMIINGVTVYGFRSNYTALLVERGNWAISFPVPIKIDRGTAISAVNATSTAEVAHSVTITGYTVET